MRTTTIHRTCTHCADETIITMPAARWEAWNKHQVSRALDGLDPDTCRWLTTLCCPDCYRDAIRSQPADQPWEGQCAGCGTWETFAVSTAALQAVHTGQLTPEQALPHLTADQRCMLEMHCHIDCYCDAVYGRPPGEPNPFATA